jgi:hypothetical protein
MSWLHVHIHRVVFTLTAEEYRELGYNVMEGTEYFVSLWMNGVITEEYNVTVNSGINWYRRISEVIDEVRLNRCRL